MAGKPKGPKMGAMKMPKADKPKMGSGKNPFAAKGAKKPKGC